MIDGGELDELLDRILRASGSALRNYTMQKSLDDMRAAVRAVYDRGREDGEIAMMNHVLKQDERDAALTKIAADIRREHGFD